MLKPPSASPSAFSPPYFSSSGPPSQALLLQASAVTSFTETSRDGTHLTINLDPTSPSSTPAGMKWGREPISDHDLLTYCSCLYHLIHDYAAAGQNNAAGSGNGKYIRATVHIANNNLTDESMSVFLDLLLKEKVELKLFRAHKNRLGKGTCSALCHLIENMSTAIEEIHLSHNMFVGKDATAICISLFKKSTYYNTSPSFSCSSAVYPRWDSRQCLHVPVWLRLELNGLPQVLTLPQGRQLFCLCHDRSVCSKSMCKQSQVGDPINKCPIAHVLYFPGRTAPPPPHIMPIPRQPAATTTNTRTTAAVAKQTPPAAGTVVVVVDSHRSNVDVSDGEVAYQTWGAAESNAGDNCRPFAKVWGTGRTSNATPPTSSITYPSGSAGTGNRSSSSSGSGISSGSSSSHISRPCGSSCDVRIQTGPQSNSTTPAPPPPKAASAHIMSAAASSTQPFSPSFSPTLPCHISPSQSATSSSLFLPLTAPFLPPPLPPIPPPPPLPSGPSTISTSSDEAMLSVVRDVVSLEYEVALLEHQLDGSREHPLTCGVCTDKISSYVTIPCGHLFCVTCLGAYAKSSPAAAPLCPFCSQTVRKCQPLPRLMQLSHLRAR
eukprot:GHVS01081202.1.p1 GENE.GHVS01081202.1~~GHVS01081202.1.p1  ORF type:complete len:605 (+),score=114.43 GHVS01081202.1:131-1945(+)